MTSPNRPLKVFLCHAHADRDAVKALYTRLTNDGVDAWLDKEKLLPGQDWELEIRKAVRESDVVVVCLSKQFNQAGFRQKEVRLALDTAMEQPEGEIFIIPARLEECDTLESLKKWHWVDLFDDDGYERLMRALRARADHIGVILQSRRKWLPKVSTPRVKSEKQILEPIPLESKPAPPSLKEEIDRKTPKPRNERSLPSKIKLQHNPNTTIIIALIGFVGLIVVILLNLPLIEEWFSIVPTPTNFPTMAPVTLTRQPVTPSKTITPSQTPTKVVLITSTPIVFNPHPEASDYFDSFGVPMRLISTGTYTIGELNKKHQVSINTFYIDKYEVTNRLYSLCETDGDCEPPKYSRSQTHSSYYGNSVFDDYPVIWVDWHMANAYCQWRGARLPTEVEWEAAASGEAHLTYPWGNIINDCTFANYFAISGFCEGDMIQVGSYEKGKSPFGVYDMVGNVGEWVSSLYQPYPYDFSDGREDLDASGSRVIRGAASVRYYSSTTSSHKEGDVWTSIFRLPIRLSYVPTSINYFIGFRCARNATP